MSLPDKKSENRIVAVIPARGGSKGIPRKNIKMIAGKPLIAWTIEPALRADLVEDVFVSTEDQEIAAIAKEHGAKILMRPDELALDETPTISVLQYHVEKDLPDAKTIVLLQCTSPIRNDDLIDECIKKYKESGADSLATGFMCKFEEWGSGCKPRQQKQGFFYDDGNVYVCDRDVIMQGSMAGNKKESYFIDREQNIEIDDDFDFWLAEQVLQKRKKWAKNGQFRS